MARGQLDPSADYEIESLKQAVSSDLELLRGFADEARRVPAKDDPKLIALVDALAKIAKDAADEALSDEDERNRRKVVVFSYFADTVDWLSDALPDRLRARSQASVYLDRTALLTGSKGNAEEILFGFCPVSMEAPIGRDNDRFDLVLTTDVLAEGVNLQQARHIVNFDLPWNPMRLVQRHGRSTELAAPMIASSCVATSPTVGWMRCWASRNV